MVGRTALAAFLNGFLLVAGALLLSGPAAFAADPEDEESVYLVLMAGTSVPHIIKMRDMARCEEAAEFSGNAHCVEALDETMALAEAEGILDFATAAGAEEPEDEAEKAEDEEDVAPRANPYAK